MKRRGWTAVGLAVLVALLAWGVYSHWRADALQHATIAQLWPIDVDADGRDELVVVYVGLDDFGSITATETTVEAVDAEEGVLWSTRLEETAMPILLNQQTIGDDGERVFISYWRRQGDGSHGLTALRASDGEALWTSEPVEGGWWASGNLVVHNGLVITFTNQLTVSENAQHLLVIARDAATGAERWRRRMERDGKTAPTRVGDTLVFPDRGRLTLLDLNTGETDHVEGLAESSGLWPLSDELITFDADGRAVALQAGDRSVVARSDVRFEITSTPSTMLTDTLVITGLGSTTLRAQRRDGSDAWQLEAPEGLRFDTSGRRDIDPVGAPGVVGTRFVPLTLTPETLRSQRLALLDVEEGSLSWTGGPVSQLRVHRYSPFSVGERYFVPLVVETAAYLLVVNGDAGTIEHAFRLDGDERRPAGLYLDLPHQPWLTRGDRVYGFSQGDFWALDLSRDDGVFPFPGAIEMASDLAPIRDLLGPLPGEH